jgi:hypothetical protein
LTLSAKPLLLTQENELVKRYRMPRNMASRSKDPLGPSKTTIEDLILMDKTQKQKEEEEERRHDVLGHD